MSCRCDIGACGSYADCRHKVVARAEHLRELGRAPTSAELYLATVCARDKAGPLPLVCGCDNDIDGPGTCKGLPTSSTAMACGCAVGACSPSKHAPVSRFGPPITPHRDTLHQANGLS